MKQFKIIAFILTSFSIVAQDYVPMAVDSATWVLASTDENPIFNNVKVLRIEGDTVVNSSTYSKIYKYTVDDSKLISQSRLLIGLIRDDIDERKVYGGIFEEQEQELSIFLNEEGRCDWGNVNSFNEHLLYDFSLQEGDSIDICMLTKPTVIINKESINRFGYNRTSFELEDDEYIIMSEGIGTCLGIFKGQTCFYTGGGFTYGLANYCIGSFENCGLLTATEDQNRMPNDVTISPNPVIDRLMISSSKQVSKVILYDLNGRFLKEIENTDEINMSKFESGTYILRLEDDLGNQHSIKVVKL